MKLAAALSAGIALIFAAPTWAQTAPAAATPEKLALAHKLMTTMHIEAMVDQMTSAIQKPMMQSMTGALPASERKSLQAFQDALIEEMRTSFTPKLMEASVELYAEDFTVEELTAMETFYSTPIGQSVLAKQPLIGQQMGPLVVKELPGFMRRTFDRYCNATTCSAEERAKNNALIDAMYPKKPTI